MYVPWTLKYKPQTLSEVVDNEDAKKAILQWVQSWDRGVPKKRALFLYGPPGTGKTVSVETLASDLDMELVQSNASDYRTAEAVERFAGEHLSTAPFPARDGSSSSTSLMALLALLTGVD